MNSLHRSERGSGRAASTPPDQVVLALAWRESRASGRRALARSWPRSRSGWARSWRSTRSPTACASPCARRRARSSAQTSPSTRGAPFTPTAEALRRRRAPGDETAGRRGPGRHVRRDGLRARRRRRRASCRCSRSIPAIPSTARSTPLRPGSGRGSPRAGGRSSTAALLVSLGARLGDELALGEARFRIRATVENMPGDVGVRSAIGPRVFIPRARVSETKLLSFGSRGQYQAYLRLPRGDGRPRRSPSAFAGPLAAERVTIRTVSDDQRRLSETLGRFGNFLGLVALVAVLLGGLGVASAVHVFIKRRLPTIAVLRCLGASARTILAAYLLQALVVGLAGQPARGGARRRGPARAAPPAARRAAGRRRRGRLPARDPRRHRHRRLDGGRLLAAAAARGASRLPARRAAARLRAGAGPAPATSPAARPPWRSPRAWSRWPCSRPAVSCVGLAFAGGIGVALGALALAAFCLVRGLRRFFPARLPYLYRQGLANLYRPANQTLMVVLALGFGAFLLEHAAARAAQPAARPARRPRRDAAERRLLRRPAGPAAGRRAARARRSGRSRPPCTPIVPMRIQSLKGRAASELLAIEDPPQRPERWALRREYRSSYRDALASVRAPRRGLLVAPRRVEGPRRGRTRADRHGRRAGPRAAAWPSATRSCGTCRACSSARASRACVRSSGRASSRTSSSSSPRALSTTRRRATSCSRASTTPTARARLQRGVVEAHPNVSTLDLAQVQRAIERVLDRVILAVRFMALFSLAAGATRAGRRGGGQPSPARPRGRPAAHARRDPAAARADPARRVRRARRPGGRRRDPALVARRLGSRPLRLRRRLRPARTVAARAAARGPGPDRDRRPVGQHRGLASPPLEVLRAERHGR